MQDSSTYGVVLVTVASPQQGEAIARTLLSEKLVACVNMLPVNSWYWWQDEIVSDREYQLIVKTDLNRFDELADKIKALHSYEVPEIIAIPVVAGSRAYLDWLGKNLNRQ